MAIEPRNNHGHPAIRTGVAVVAVVLVAMLVLDAVSVVVGLFWTVIKVALLVLLVAGAIHIFSGRRRSS